MADEAEHGEAGTIESQLKAALDRSHSSSERAAQQFSKLLGTVHGGLGIACATWLQRIFELPISSRLATLAVSLASALAFVALGLLALVATMIVDQRSASHGAKAAIFKAESAKLAMALDRYRKIQLGDEKSAGELACAVMLEDLQPKTVIADSRAVWINEISEWLGLASWACLFWAFVAIAFGIGITIFKVGFYLSATRN